jgi:prephenate dehydrogenase
LLGGSLGMAIRARRLTGPVWGFVRRSESLKECQSRGAADVVTTDLRAAVSGAQLIVLCTPVASMLPLAEQFLPFVRKGCVITDVGSVKAQVVEELQPLARRAGAHFVGAHPMAGSELGGVSAAKPDLFCGAACVLTPTRDSSPRAIRLVEALWQGMGAEVLRLSPQKHDRIVSRTSHLPYFTAAAMSRLVLDPSHPAEQPKLCAGGFRDSTRVASGSPEMWRDIAMANRQEVADAIGILIRDLKQMRNVILRAKPRLLEKRLVEAKTRRDRWRAEFLDCKL